MVALHTLVACATWATLSYAQPAGAPVPSPAPSGDSSTGEFYDTEKDGGYYPSVGAEADRLLAEGKALQEAGEHGQAVERLREAFAIQNRADIAAVLGRSEVKAGHYARAAEHLAFAIAGLGATNPLQAQAYGDMEVARNKVATVRFRTEPPGAALTIDGRSVGTVDEERAFYLMPGSHMVVARAPGFAEARRPLELEAASQKTITLVLEKSTGGEAEDGDRTVFAWIGAGGLVAMTGLFIGAGVLGDQANGLRQDADALDTQLSPEDGTNRACLIQPETCQQIQSDFDSAKGRQQASVGLWIGGGWLVRQASVY
ncbi:MAG: PEGA domain-containing protein [Myxococcota bacterium]